MTWWYDTSKALGTVPKRTDFESTDDYLAALERFVFTSLGRQQPTQSLYAPGFDGLGRTGLLTQSNVVGSETGGVVVTETDGDTIVDGSVIQAQQITEGNIAEDALSSFGFTEGTDTTLTLANTYYSCVSQTVLLTSVPILMFIASRFLASATAGTRFAKYKVDVTSERTGSSSTVFESESVRVPVSPSEQLYFSMYQPASFFDGVGEYTFEFFVRSNVAGDTAKDPSISLFASRR